MSETARADSSANRRVAVVVVAGVGDTPRSDAAQRVASGLVVYAGFDPPEEHSEWFTASGGIQPLQRFAYSRRPAWASCRGLRGRGGLPGLPVDRERACSARSVEGKLAELPAGSGRVQP